MTGIVSKACVDGLGAVSARQAPGTARLIGDPVCAGEARERRDLHGGDAHVVGGGQAEGHLAASHILSAAVYGKRTFRSSRIELRQCDAVELHQRAPDRALHDDLDTVLGTRSPGVRVDQLTVGSPRGERVDDTSGSLATIEIDGELAVLGTLGGDQGEAPARKAEGKRGPLAGRAVQGSQEGGLAPARAATPAARPAA